MLSCEVRCVKRLWLFISILLCLVCCSCSHTPVKETYSMFAMNTSISVTFYDVKDSKNIARNIEKIYLKYDSYAGDFDSYYGTLNVYDLNQRRSIEASSELLEMVNFALEAKEDTLGYFEPLLGRLSHAWKDSLSNNKLLDDEFINNELEIIKNSSIKIEGNVISIIGDANLDLGGIAKGYATKKVQEYLKSIDVDTYLLNAGNSNVVLGNKLGEDFSVGLKNPFKPEYYKILSLKDISIGTSSMEHQHSLIDNVYYSHLLNPKTGKPSTYYDTISIIGDDSAYLDAYSTACFAMDIDTTKEFLKSKGYEWIAHKDGKIVYQSEGVSLYEKV